LDDLDYDNELGFKVSLVERYQGDCDWFEVDVNSLTIETCIHDGGVSSSAYLTAMDERPKQISQGQASWYKSLDWNLADDDEFTVDFSNCNVSMGSPDFPIISLASKPWVLFPQHITSTLFRRLRAVARDARKHRKKMRELELQREREQEEQKKKQQLEIQQKQKDLLQIAIKRAQNSQQSKKTAVAPPAVPVKPIQNTWSSSAASPPPSVPAAIGSNAWSSSAARPLTPPPVPVSWTVIPGPIAPMVPSPVAMQPAMVPNPWSAQNPWSSVEIPQAKRPRPHPDPAQKQ
jgi:hypothetical protein